MFHLTRVWDIVSCEHTNQECRKWTGNVVSKSVGVLFLSDSLIIFVSWARYKKWKVEWKFGLCEDVVTWLIWVSDAESFGTGENGIVNRSANCYIKSDRSLLFVVIEKWRTAISVLLKYINVVRLSKGKSRKIKLSKTAPKSNQNIA